MTTILNYAAYDPRISAIFIDIGHLQCGYAKLTELRRALDLFRQSGKTVTAYSESADQKSLFAALSMDALYVPPDGNVEALGFAGEAQFYGGVFNKTGIEPQVQRIGKYKSYGDSLIRSNISSAQREVTSSILTEVSRHWISEIARGRNKTVDQVLSLWSDRGHKTPHDFKTLGFISGVRYIDQVEGMLKTQFSRKENRSLVNRFIHYLASLVETAAKKAARDRALSTVHSDDTTSDFSTASDFEKHPRRTEEFGNVTTSGVYVDRHTRLVHPDFLGGKTYLRKMRFGSRALQGLPVVEVTRGPRIAIINAAGGIGPGKGQAGVSIGADTLIEQIREARDDPDIKATVIRVDSPGGGALASDLIWRELRCLSRVKPVVASMVDVAASGGYYLAMACDRIVAEQTTLTGSIGVVAGKFNARGLADRVGLGVETISIGRYAEVSSLTQGFTEEEGEFFAAGARQAYASFTRKAALSRNMSEAAMEEVAQGRVWTGRQALSRGLVDKIGGLRSALQLAANLSVDYLPLQYKEHYTRTRNGEIKNASQVVEHDFDSYPPLRVQTLLPGGGRLRALARRRLSETITEAIMEPLTRMQRLQGQKMAVMDDSVQFVDVMGESSGMHLQNKVLKNVVSVLGTILRV
eukprot:gene21842-27913_t